MKNFEKIISHEVADFANDNVFVKRAQQKIAIDDNVYETDEN